MLQDSKTRDLLTLFLDSESLKFGRFTTKAGRESFYFFNFGAMSTGLRLKKLACFYVDHLEANKIIDNVDLIYGPAYKGISLAAAVCMEIASRFGKDIAFCTKRKEAKNHGETGHWIGTTPKKGQKILIIDDVLSSGLSVLSAIKDLAEEGILASDIAGVLVTVDRQEMIHPSASSTARAAATYLRSLIPHTMSICTLEELFRAIIETPKHFYPKIKESDYDAVVLKYQQLKDAALEND